MSLVCSWDSTELLGDGKPAASGGLVHDFATWNRGLLTNVRKGGFRKDLSMELERPALPISGQPDPVKTALYTASGDIGINFQELWAYYNLSNRANNNNLGLKWSSGSIPFTTGGTIPSGTPYLELAANAGACMNDDFFYFKQPTVIGYQLVLSLQTRVVGTTNRLHIVTDPIITLWNPLDVPVVVPANLPLTVKYWSVPYTLRVAKNGVSSDLPIAAISKSDQNFLSLQVGLLDRLVFRPGEVIKLSQFQNLLAKSDAGDIHKLAGKKGFNFGKGVAFQASTVNDAKVDVVATDKLVLQSLMPNDYTAGARDGHGKIVQGGYEHKRHYSLTHHEYYVGDDRGSSNSLGIGAACLDYDFGLKRLGVTEKREELDPGNKKTDRYNATQRTDVFKTFTANLPIPTSGAKMPIMMFSFNAKTETGKATDTRCLSRFNPKALHVDFYDFKAADRENIPYEYKVEQLNGWKSADDSLQIDTTGRGYFGGAMNARDGSSFVTTHSVPREPIVSLASFQHSFANGFNMQRPKSSYATINAREPLLPQISHAIGNSLACPLLAPGETTGRLQPGNRPIADHSYLANLALWDDWFLSGIAPQNGATFAANRPQKKVATDFFSGDKTGQLPVSRYQPNLRGELADKLVSKFLPGTRPADIATKEIASYIQVDGMFNVNSTSVEAWKSLLGARNGRPMVVRDEMGKESIVPANTDGTPVSGLLGPMNYALKGGNDSMNDPAQWVGWRALSEDEIDSLARGIVKEVRKRGPFLSLADFVNRRVGSDKELARAGAIQSALDSNDVTVNSSFNQGARSSGGGSTFAFADAEKGPLSYGAPGIVKQADILTPIAPILSARSDTFLVRAYGEKIDASGKVLARAWCEATVQRDFEFVDPSDTPAKDYATISTLNKTFGRRFNIVSFRWLSSAGA